MLGGLGTWHLSIGLGKVAVSADGRLVRIVGLRSDGSKTAADCVVVWTLSSDGGWSWSAPADIPDLRSDGGEGRRRPRLAWQRDRFALVIHDPRRPDISSLWQLLCPPQAAAVKHR